MNLILNQHHDDSTSLGRMQCIATLCLLPDLNGDEIMQ